MHIILWKFTVREEHTHKFTAAYGSEGDWASLFRQAEGFLGTELLRSGEEPNVFLTVDRWKSATSFDSLKKEHAAEYKKLDAKFRSLHFVGRKARRLLGAVDIGRRKRRLIFLTLQRYLG